MAPKRTSCSDSERADCPDALTNGNAPADDATAGPSRPKRARTSVTHYTNESAPPATPRAKALRESKAASASPSAKGTPVRKGRAPAKAKATFNPLPSRVVSERYIGPDYEKTEPVEQCSVFAWGTANTFQLGLGVDVTDDVLRPRLHPFFEAALQETPPSIGEHGVSQVACGGQHTIVVDSNGKIWTFGSGDGAQLGRRVDKVVDPEKPEVDGEPNYLDSEALQADPAHPDGLEDFVAVRAAAGDTCSVAVDGSGQVRCWGMYRNAEGNFGFNGPVTDATPDGGRVYTPMALPGLSHHRIVDVSCGMNHTLGLTDTGRVIAWGVADQGQLGRKPLERRKFSSLEPEPLALRNIVSIATGSYTSFAIDKDGRVFAWGLNAHRQTGVAYDDLPNPSFPDIVGAPTLVSALDPKEHDGHRCTSIQSGEHFTLFLMSDGSVYSVGRTDDNQSGLPADHPAILADKAELAEIDAIRLEHLPAERERVRKEQSSWPTELPEGEDPKTTKIKLRESPDAQEATAMMNVYTRYEKHDVRVDEPQRITFPDDAGPMRAIGAGLRVGFAVSRKGQLYGWGMSFQGALGLGSTDLQATPALVTSKTLKGRIVLDVSCGGDFNFVKTTGPKGPFPDGFEAPAPAA